MSKSKTKASRELPMQREIRIARAFGVIPPESPAPIKGTNLKLPQPVVECLARLKSTYGMSNTFAITRAVLALEQTLAEQNRLK